MIRRGRRRRDSAANREVDRRVFRALVPPEMVAGVDMLVAGVAAVAEVVVVAYVALEAGPGEELPTAAVAVGLVLSWDISRREGRRCRGWSWAPSTGGGGGRRACHERIEERLEDGFALAIASSGACRASAHPGFSFAMLTMVRAEDDLRNAFHGAVVERV